MSRRLHVVRAEMRLSRPDTEPLRPVEMVPDPLEPFQRVLANVDVANGERGDVVVDLLPLTPEERLRFRARQQKAEITGFAKATGPSGKGGAGGIVGALTNDLLSMGATRESVAVPRNEAARRFGEVDVDHLVHRVAVPTALFQIQVLIRTASFDNARAHAHADALMACFELWSGRNWFELVLTNLKVGYFGSNLGPRRWWFDYRFTSGRFGPLRHRPARVVGIEDVAGWITPPPPAATEPTPPPAPQPTPARRAPAPTQQLPPAEVQSQPDETAVLVRDGILDQDGELLLYGIGRRGTAVDGLAAELVDRAAHAGVGIVVLDADSADQRAGAPAWGDPSLAAVPLLTADVTRPVPGWNPLLPTAAESPVDRAAVAVRALTVAAGSVNGSQVAALIGAAVSTLRTLVAFLPRRLAPTLFQIARLIEDTGWRQTALPVLDGPTRRFWTEVLPSLDTGVVRRVTELVRSLEDNATATALLGQPETTYDPYAMLAAGNTVVLSGDVSPLHDALAMLLWLDASAAARALMDARTDAPPLLVATGAHRHGVDREGLFMHDLTATVQSGVRVVLLTDRPELHNRDVRRGLRRLATVVAVDSLDTGAEVAASWVGLDDASELQATLDNLGLGECLVVAAAEGWRPRAVDVRRRAWTDMTGGRPAAVDLPGGQTLHNTRARLEGLEHRIAEHLLSPAGPEPHTVQDQEPTSGTGTNVISFDPSRRRKGPSPK